jgi:hypothetical protein
MSIQGKWRITEMPDFVEDYPDRGGPAYIEFGKSGGEFVFGCLTGVIHGRNFTARCQTTSGTGLLTTRRTVPPVVDPTDGWKGLSR